MSQRDVICWREILRRKGIQCANINVTYRVTFAGTDGRQVPGCNDRQVAFTAHFTGVLVLLLVIVGNCPQQMLLFFAAGESRLAGDDVAWA
ncbi:hypothetical protein D3C73_1359390 [compost metagenome]